MPSEDRFTVTVAEWLESEASGPAPDWLHEAAMASVVRLRQRPAWHARLRSIWLSGPPERVQRRERAIRVGLVLAAVVLALLAIASIGARRSDPILTQNGSILVARKELAQVTRYLTMGPDGSAEHDVFSAEECGQCAFLSRDGTRIMIPETSGDRLTTAIVRADGSSKIVLLPFPDTTVNLGPGGWSRDGLWIALAGWDDTDPERRGIYVARSDGTGLRQVTHSLDGRAQDWPTFSPDGTRLLFLAQDPTGPPGGGVAGDLFVVNLDGTGLRQLNPAGTKVHESTELGRPMDWSPDGGRIAFAVIDGEHRLGRSSRFVVRAADAATLWQSPWDRWNVSVEWSPTGEWLLSGGFGAGNEWIEIVRPDGSERRELWSATAAEPACCGTWSADGRWILFQRGPIDARDLWTMDTTGGSLVRLTQVPARYVWYSWAARP